MLKKWQSVLELDINRNIIAGSPEALRKAINNGADLRVNTDFYHNEHIDVRSDNHDLIHEVSDFPCTYIIDNRWVAGMMTFRQPVQLPGVFGTKASLSLFMYNENGLQSIARPLLNGGDAPIGEDTPILESKYHLLNSFDENTNGPSSNFIYDFEKYRFLVNDCWQEICSCDENGNVLSGSTRAIEEASMDGCELKVGISGICGNGGLDHTVFVQTGPHYFYHEENVMVTETRPIVRIKNPTIPLQYASGNWDYGWNIVRSDGKVSTLYYNPYTLKSERTFERHPIRWFAK